jgi:lysozyme
MTASDICKEFEGLRLEAYRCPAGVWTIGYGHTANVVPGQAMTEEQANATLELDLKLRATQLMLVVNKSVTDNQFQALLSFVFNLGIGNLKGSTLLRKVNSNPEDKTIRDEFAKWVKGGGETLPGLVRRRKKEANLYFTP